LSKDAIIRRLPQGRCIRCVLLREKLVVRLHRLGPWLAAVR
jgi:hypothetical protein